MYGFFFQAEDGIRDLVRSRGLGDVYKRQAFAFQGFHPEMLHVARAAGGVAHAGQAMDAHEHIDQRALAHIASSDECILRQARLGPVSRLATAAEVLGFEVFHYVVNVFPSHPSRMALNSAGRSIMAACPHLSLIHI